MKPQKFKIFVTRQWLGFDKQMEQTKGKWKSTAVTHYYGMVELAFIYSCCRHHSGIH